MFSFNQKDLEYAYNIVKELHIPRQLGSYEDEDYEPDQLYEQILDLGYDCRIMSGASKVVLIFEELPFVIKIPFNGRWYREYFNEDNEPIEDEDNWYFDEFCYADCYHSWDYCGDELGKIDSMKHAGYDKLAADTMFLCTVCGRDIYVQEKVKTYCCHYKKPSQESLDKVISGDYYHRYQFQEDWMALVFDTYGQEFFDNFLDWCENVEPTILDDMHSGNYGYRIDGTPVMFDVSGYRD